ncbi:MAG: hypothetical protein ACYC10_07850 [Allorhizobium sp.]
MTYDGPEPTFLIGLHNMAELRGDGLVAGFGERLATMETAEIIALPGLHQRPRSRQPIYNPGEGGFAAENVIPFPRPKWTRNAERRKT